MKTAEILRTLQHAEWHCRFGPANLTHDRLDQTEDDREAAELLAKLRKQLKAESVDS